MKTLVSLLVVAACLVSVGCKGPVEEVKAYLDEKGEVRRFVNVYVNEEDIRFLQNQNTPLKSGDEISIIPAIAGG